MIAALPNAYVQQATNSCASSIVAVAGAAVDQLIKERPFLGEASFGVLATEVASADLPESTAYLVTKAVFEHFGEFNRSLAALVHIARATMSEDDAVALDPGAIRRLKESGLMK